MIWYDRTGSSLSPSQMASCASTLLPPPHPPSPHRRSGLTRSLHLPLSISTGWQDGTQERRPRGGKWQPCDSVSGRVESYIYPLPEGHSESSHTAQRAHTPGSVRRCFRERTDTDGLKWKVSEMSLCDLFFSPAAAFPHEALQPQEAATVKRPWRSLRSSTGLQRWGGARIWSSPDVLTAGDCHPVIDSDLYPCQVKNNKGIFLWEKENCTPSSSSLESA